MDTFTMDEAGQWLNVWERTGREPFAHPSYVRLFARPGDKALALYWQSQGSEVLLPLILRSLPDEPWAISTGSIWHDAISPYGYGGPFFSGQPNWQAFYTDLLAWMRRQQVLTAFIRASLENVPPPLELEGYEALALSENVAVDVSRSPDEQWGHYEHKVRKNVKKAQRAELSVEIHTDFRHLSGFLEIYHRTMKRRSAGDWYYFDESFFKTFDEQLRGNFVVAEVFQGEQLVSTELILESEKFLYSYLGGTREEAFVHAPNDLLKHAVIDYGRQKGKLAYVLGGGYSPDDGIFRYKRTFDKAGVRPFFGVRLIANTAVYAVLVEARYQAVPASGVAGHFFPAYRAPIVETVEESV